MTEQEFWTKYFQSRHFHRVSGQATTEENKKFQQTISAQPQQSASMQEKGISEDPFNKVAVEQEKEDQGNAVYITDKGILVPLR